MLFCPTCGNILLIEKGSGAIRYFCKTCPYIFNVNQKLTRIVTFDDKKEEDLIIGEKEEYENVGTVEIACIKCGNNKAYYKEIQLRSADEATTQFYKCTKCGVEWRIG